MYTLCMCTRAQMYMCARENVQYFNKINFTSRITPQGNTSKKNAVYIIEYKILICFCLKVIT